MNNAPEEVHVKQVIAGMVRDGAEPIQVIRRLQEELGESFSEFSFSRYFLEVFEVPLLNIRRASAWEGLPYGAYLTDDEVNALLSPLKVRAVWRGHGAG